MVYSYYPGCTLKTKAVDLDRYARLSAQILGFKLEEPDDWQCCGAVYPLGTDEIAAKLAAVRVLAAANKKNQPLVTLCSACHNVLKRVNDDMKNDKDINRKANNYLKEEGEEPYNGTTEVLHFMEVLQRHIGFDKLKEAVKNPLTGRKIGAYYGCMLLRPSQILQFDDPENPSIFEEFIRALGGEPVAFACRNECCGGYISLKEKERATQMTSKILKNAAQDGADTLITACPLCLYNMNITNKTIKPKDSDLTFSYFTELLAQALGAAD